MMESKDTLTKLCPDIPFRLQKHNLKAKVIFAK